LFQVLSNLTMEPPAGLGCEAIRDERVKVLRMIPSLRAENLVRGQFRGYRNEKGVAANSQVETFAALKLEINSWRWQGTPFYLRAGKNLPVTCTEVYVQLRQPPTLFHTPPLPNYLRFRLTPNMVIALGATVKQGGEDMTGESVELIALEQLHGSEIDAYEWLLTEAMRGDPTHFAREDYVEEAWRIAESVLGNETPTYEYDPGTWGPTKTDKVVAPPGGWWNPAATSGPGA
jgi:glucose-6-phosphate 1-dehydrogenase